LLEIISQDGLSLTGQLTAAGIVFYPNFYKWMDQASHHFFAKIGFSSSKLMSEDKIGLPLLETSCKFHQPLVFEDQFVIKTSIDEIKNNPAVSVLLGYEEKGLTDSYIEITGNSTINQSQNVKSKYWDESFNKWFEGPEDPNYVYLEINPETIRILNMQGEPPQELNL